MAGGIDAGAHGGHELRKLPVLDEIEVGSERPELPRDAAGQIRAMAFATILIRQDIFAELKGHAHSAATLGTKAKPCPSLKYRLVPDSVDLLILLEQRKYLSGSRATRSCRHAARRCDRGSPDYQENCLRPWP